MSRLEKLLADIEISRVKRRLKQALARKPKPAKVNIPDEDVPAGPVKKRVMQQYHTDYEGNLLVDENGDNIPSYICICFAHESSECACGGWDTDTQHWQELFGEIKGE
jgi:hypothetical protein